MKKFWILMLLFAAPAFAQDSLPDWNKRASTDEVWTVVFLVQYLYAENVGNNGDDTREVDCAIERFLAILAKIQDEDGPVTRRQLWLHAGWNFRQLDRSRMDACTFEKVERDLS